MSFSEWKEYKLGDILDISSSKRIYAKEYVKDGIPFYRGKEIIEKFNGNDVSNELFITYERFYELKNKFGAPDKGDILLTSVGTLGVPYLVRDEQFYFKDGNLTWFRNFKTFCYNKFIYLWIQSEYCKNQIYGKSIGSTQKALTIDTLKKFDIKLPTLEEQKAIAHILSTLDEKIETNNQINKKLEEMVQAIFKQWFVNFEFLSGDGEPYKSSGGEMVESELGRIPKGWEVKKLGEICDVKGGKRLPKGKGVQDEKTQYPYIRVTDVNSGYVDMKSIKYIDEDTRKAISRYIINYEDVYISIAGTIGLVGTITKELDKASLTENMARIVTKGVNKYFIKLYLNSKDGQFQITSKAVGSTQPKLPLYAIKSIPIVVADESTDKKFSLIINSIFEKIENNLINSNYLGEIRDMLLPKLMSGEIRVPLNKKN